MQQYNVSFYDLPDGSEPVKEFLDSLDVKMRAKIAILCKSRYIFFKIFVLLR